MPDNAGIGGLWGEGTWEFLSSAAAPRAAPPRMKVPAPAPAASAMNLSWSRWTPSTGSGRHQRPLSLGAVRPPANGKSPGSRDGIQGRAVRR
jgi:hypothetical protein